MQLLKFGGTSVGSVKNMKVVSSIINSPTPKIVVLSAISGTTNSLVKITSLASEKEYDKVDHHIAQLRSHYDDFIEELFDANKFISQVRGYIDEVFEEIHRLASTINFSSQMADAIVAQGELLSTYIFTSFLNQEGIDAVLLPALEFMRIDKDHEPDKFYIRKNIERVVSNSKQVDLYITQGFIARNYEGQISNLQRGGSDYTATIIGSAIGASEVQIWTDIDGFHNNDPRFVTNTQAIPALSYDEAAELAYFGAKILHPQTVQPLRDSKIPLLLKNTMDPEAEGTVITYRPTGEGVKAIAAKDGITAIKIKSGRMLLAHGFLNKVFEIFARYETAIDMITTSEIAVSLTVEETTHLAQIEKELSAFAQVTLDTDQTIICIVGSDINRHANTPELFKVLHDVSVRMISYGGSNNNISLLVSSEDKKRALELLQTYLFSVEVVA